MKSLVVQWAKCGNDEDIALKEQQMQTTKPSISASSFTHLKGIKHDVTYVGLNLRQKLQTNYEVVSIK
jgi:hypothetical protein